MKIRILVILAFSLVLFVSSCGEEEGGACEVKQPSATGGSIYYCLTNVNPDLCGNLGGIESVYHEGTPCTALGYTVPSSADFEGRFTVDADNLNTPGANGAFKDDVVVNQGPDCSDGYGGPLFDPQIDSQCQVAFVYYCDQVQEGVEATCALYKAYQDNDPSIPDCPYCG